MQVNCLVPGCPHQKFRRGMCDTHYRRWLRYGTPGPVTGLGKHAPLDERFVNNVQPASPPVHAPQLGGCYLWCGYVHESGFGAIRHGHRMIYVHRMAWERSYGPIPFGARVRQVCGVRLCVRPDHLELA